MRGYLRYLAALACGVVVAVAASSSTLLGQYSLTVNKERLLNAQNEPQNWLLMNGDYNALRYSKLTQINRTNVKDLRMAYVPTELAAPGTEFSIDVRGRPSAARVVSLPFYKRT